MENNLVCQNRSHKFENIDIHFFVAHHIKFNMGLVTQDDLKNGIIVTENSM
jgi:hypothetical protein